MKETIVTRTAAELLKLESDLIDGKVTIGRYWMLGRRLLILQKYLAVCERRKLDADIAVRSLVLECYRLKEKYFNCGYI